MPRFLLRSTCFNHRPEQTHRVTTLDNQKNKHTNVILQQKKRTQKTTDIYHVGVHTCIILQQQTRTEKQHRTPTLLATIFAKAIRVTSYGHNAIIKPYNFSAAVYTCSKQPNSSVTSTDGVMLTSVSLAPTPSASP